MKHRPVLTIIAQRLGLGLVTLFLVSVVIFVAVEMLPGGFAEAVLGQSATPESVAAFNRETGLDQPATVRYFSWILGALHGDFGFSYAGIGSKTPRAVASIIAPRLYNTLFLAALTALVAVPLSVALGILTAMRRNSLFDRLANAVTLSAIAMPEFLVAYLLMIAFALKLRWLPTLSLVTDRTDLAGQLRAAALPAMTLTLVIVAHIMRMTRAAIIHLMDSPYAGMARMKGLSPHKIILHHILPNAWAPIAAVVSFNLAYLVVGVVIVEAVFVYPGVGHLLIDAVSTRDMPVVQACTLIFAATYVLLNLTADIVNVVTNPRLLYPR